MTRSRSFRQVKEMAKRFGFDLVKVKPEETKVGMKFRLEAPVVNGRVAFQGKLIEEMTAYLEGYTDRPFFEVKKAEG